MVPLSAVLALIEAQNAFNAQLVDKLGLHLEKMARSYEEALNPPLPSGHDGEMSLTAWSDEAEDLQYQLDSGIIDPVSITPGMKRILDGATTHIEP